MNLFKQIIYNSETLKNRGFLIMKAPEIESKPLIFYKYLSEIKIYRSVSNDIFHRLPWPGCSGGQSAENTAEKPLPFLLASVEKRICISPLSADSI